MLERKVYSELMRWKALHSKCLVIKGQRQVGKTFIIEHFARNEYESFVKLDFSVDESLADIFGVREVDEMVRRIELRTGREVKPGATLIFLDEIQECPEAYSSLKPFSIDGRFDVIASGSMLGVDRKRRDGNGPDPLIPLGYEEVLVMRGLDFEEFLWASKVPKDMISEVRRSIASKQELDRFYLDRFRALFREFMIVGGMPESVQAYVETKDFKRSDKVLDGLLSTCIRDINRYNSGEDIAKTAECFESIPSQLAESNKRFMYSRIQGDRIRKASDRYMGNLLWIRQAGYGNFCYLLRKPEAPLMANIVRDQFKVYLSDTGMLVHMYGARVADAIYSGDSRINLGAVAENAVAECLMKSGFPPCYYSKKSNPGMMEIDFVIETSKEVVAFEVKSGKDRSAPSLRKLPKHFNVGRRVMLEDSGVHVDEDGVEHYPIFAAAFVRDILGEDES
ncbi:MAG: ATP-binding protein [Candidatus Methanomethylophilaceae archaeon]|nr:ATP-binding protein [Candidatus Methanomethylophilaceae archaeon]